MHPFKCCFDDRYGDPALVDIKKRVAKAVAVAKPPSSVDIPADRFARAAVRVAQRQLAAVEPSSPVLATCLRHMIVLSPTN